MALLLVLCGFVLFAYDKDDKRGAWQTGWDRGYREGIDRGTADRNRKYDLKTKEFKQAESGYDKHVGKKDEYKKGFRAGYRTGYDEGYYGRAAVEAQPRGTLHADRSKDPAYDAGYRDGLRAGDGDFRQNRDFRPDDHADYQNADRSYSSDYKGDKRDYANRYRDGFLQGYRDGYRGVGRD